MVWKKYHHAIAKLFSKISQVMYGNTESNVSVDVVGLKKPIKKFIICARIKMTTFTK